MRSVFRPSRLRMILVAGVAAALLPTVAYAQRADTTGDVTICNAAGARPAPGTFVFTASAPASAGGAQSFNLAVGQCAPRVFYPIGVVVTIMEALPNGYAVTAISLKPTSNTPTTTVISANTPSAATANVTVGTGSATVTFTTSGAGSGNGGGGGGGGTACKVPNVFGLGLAAAEAAVRRAHCTVGKVRKVYSRIYYPDVVYSQSPQRGTVLAPRAPVSLTVSLGRHS